MIYKKKTNKQTKSTFVKRNRTTKPLKTKKGKPPTQRQRTTLWRATESQQKLSCSAWVSSFGAWQEVYFTWEDISFTAMDISTKSPPPNLYWFQVNANYGGIRFYLVMRLRTRWPLCHDGTNAFWPDFNALKIFHFVPLQPQ